MRVNGSFALNAPVGQVWAAVTDPAVLAGVIPGCEEFELSAGSARLTVDTTVAATGAAYTVAAYVTGRQQPDWLTVALEARGEPGSLTGTLQLRLAGSDGATNVSYEIDAAAAGRLAAVGGSLLTATVKRLATRFFEALGEALARGPGLAAVSAGQATAAAAPRAAAEAGGVTAEPVTAASPAAAQTAEPPPPVPVAPAPPDLVSASRQRRLGQGFAPGVLVGAAIGVAAAKLGALLARRSR